MKIENIIDVITYSVLYYDSLIKRFDITDTLISGVKTSILRMWNEYMSDIEDMLINTAKRLFITQ